MTDFGRRDFLKNAAVLSTLATVGSSRGIGSPIHSLTADRLSDAQPYEIAAYYLGNYHVDPRNEQAHGDGWTEWRIIQNAKPRFPGHSQPKVPLWGYEDDARPVVFEKKISTASTAGLTAFIFDWYWYNDGPFLQGALERGYLQSRNKADLKFALMWANHDWYDIHPAKLSGHPYLLYPGTVTRETFESLTDHVIKSYFSEPSYWKIQGCPYFSIYELYLFVQGLGGVNNAASALKSFRDKVRRAGFPDLHLNAITWGVQLLPGQTDVPDLKSLLAALAVDSTTSYVWIHHVHMTEFPVTQYKYLANGYETYRATASETLGRPYFPNVSMGWDSSPRACQSDTFVNRDYPFLPVVQGNTPDAFGEALSSARRFIDAQSEPKHKIITVNSWNEWAEGSYLEPDIATKYAYLDKVREVFGKER
jgi:hypothetical protein